MLLSLFGTRIVAHLLLRLEGASVPLGLLIEVWIGAGSGDAEHSSPDEGIARVEVGHE